MCYAHLVIADGSIAASPSNQPIRLVPDRNEGEEFRMDCRTAADARHVEWLSTVGGVFDGPGGTAMRFERCSSLVLGALLSAVPRARLHARQVLWEWGLSGIAENAELIVSELTTNAMLISRREGRPFIQLTLTLNEGDLAILVRDFCPGTPQPGNAGADDENGRGLFLVQSMSDRSGWYPADDGTPGKVVWAVVRPK